MRKPDYDLRQALEYNPQEGFTVADIQDVIAEVPGENDGSSWYWVVKLGPRKYALIRGDCDYTGWYCRSSVDVKYQTTALKAALMAPETEEFYYRRPRKWLIDQMKGRTPIGLVAPKLQV